MRPQSAKAKGRKLQQLVRDSIIAAFPSLTPRDVRSTSMGDSGEDVKLSETAWKLFPYLVECKSLARAAIFRAYEQREPQEGEVLVVIKENGKDPLACVSFKHFMELVKRCKSVT